ncbi:LGFP repeat-containing protein [Mycolicibacter minnesotensis]
MRKATQRAAAVSAAVLGVALIGTGCESTKEKTNDALSSASSIASSASSVISSAVSTAEESADASTTEITGKDGKEYTVSGPILAKLDSLDAAAKQDLGEPTGAEQKNPDGGVFQQFDGGVIVHTTRSYVVWGKIRDKWNDLGGSQGKLGYPTSDETTNADGSKQTTFEHGIVSWKAGDAEATVSEH